MMDREMFEDYLLILADHFTAEELCTELGLDSWQIIEAFRDQLEEQPINIDKYRNRG